MVAQQRLANRRCIQFTRAEKSDKSRQSTSQCLRKCLIFAEGFILQPQAQDDERVGRPVEFAVEARDEPVAPQNRHRVVAELALRLGLVDLPHVVEAEQNFSSSTRTDLIERCEEDDLFSRGRPQRCPRLRHTPGAHILQHLRVAAERVVHRLPALNLDLDEFAISQHRFDYLLGAAKWHAAMITNRSYGLYATGQRS